MNPDFIAPMQRAGAIELAEHAHSFHYMTLAATSLFFLAVCLSLMLLVRRAIKGAFEQILRLRGVIFVDGLPLLMLFKRAIKGAFEQILRLLNVVFVAELPLLMLYVRVLRTVPLSNDPSVSGVRLFLVLTSMPLALPLFLDQVFPDRPCSLSCAGKSDSNWSATSRGLQHRWRILAFIMASTLLVQDSMIQILNLWHAL
jgi:hypothetical protein